MVLSPTTDLVSIGNNIDNCASSVASRTISCALLLMTSKADKLPLETEAVAHNNNTIFTLQPDYRTFVVPKAQAKRSQHANTTHLNIVGRNMLRAFGHPVATCCDILGVVSSKFIICKLKPTTSNTSQHIAWHVACVWPGLYSTDNGSRTNAKIIFENLLSYPKCV